MQGPSGACFLTTNLLRFQDPLEGEASLGVSRNALPLLANVARKLEWLGVAEVAWISLSTSGWLETHSAPLQSGGQAFCL